MVLPATRALYAAFDRFPAPKGAATHIGHAAATLFEAAGAGVLFVLGDEQLPRHQHEQLAGSVPVEIVRSAAALDEPSLTRRTDRFADDLHRLLAELDGEVSVAQFRDPWSGVPILTGQAGHNGRSGPGPTIFEINGLPSIEWPARYPKVPRSVVARLRELERFCWERADAVVTPGSTSAENLHRIGVPPEKVHVIPNGATVPPEQPRPAGAPDRYVVYVGALQPWQGLDVAVRAFAHLADDPTLADVSLVICAASKPKSAGPLRRLADRLGISDRVLWRHRTPHHEIPAWLQYATLSLAPLTDCARNVVQGCSPLKIVESLAAATPVVASDLPVVRDVVDHGVHGLLVPADRPRALARAMRVLLEDPDATTALGRAGRERIAANFTWDHAAGLHGDLVRAMIGPTLRQEAR